MPALGAGDDLASPFGMGDNRGFRVMALFRAEREPVAYRVEKAA